MLRDTIRVRYGGTQEKQAFERMLEERPDLRRWLKAGADAAERSVAPRIRRGVLGSTANTINERIGVLLEEAMKALRAGPIEDQADEDECHAWRLGFEAVALEARDLRLDLGGWER